MLHVNFYYFTLTFHLIVNDRFNFQGLLPMQLIVQVASNCFNRCILTEAQDADVMMRVDRSGLDILTLRLTSYEWNARKSTFEFFLCIILDGIFIFIEGNLFELLRRCMELPNNYSVMPSLPLTWLELVDFTRSTFRKLSY